MTRGFSIRVIILLPVFLCGSNSIQLHVIVRDTARRTHRSGGADVDRRERIVQRRLVARDKEDEECRVERLRKGISAQIVPESERSYYEHAHDQIHPLVGVIELEFIVVVVVAR